MINNRIQEIKKKGFVMTPNDTRVPSEEYIPVDFSKIKVGLKTLEDATLDINSSLKRVDPRLANKDVVLRAIAQNDLKTMRDISNFFYTFLILFRQFYYSPILINKYFNFFFYV